MTLPLHFGIDIKSTDSEASDSDDVQGWRQEFSDSGTDPSDEGARIRHSGYCKC